MGVAFTKAVSILKSIHGGVGFSDVFALHGVFSVHDGKGNSRIGNVNLPRDADA